MHNPLGCLAMPNTGTGPLMTSRGGPGSRESINQHECGFRGVSPWHHFARGAR